MLSSALLTSFWLIISFCEIAVVCESNICGGNITSLIYNTKVSKNYVLALGIAIDGLAHRSLILGLQFFVSQLIICTPCIIKDRTFYAAGGPQNGDKS